MPRQTGTVEAGKLADLVVLDRDVTTIPVAEIKDVVPQLTMVGGKATFDITTSAGRATRRSLDAALATKSAVGRVRHDHFGGRHAGCPCTTEQRN